jgi:hypothetical protein
MGIVIAVVAMSTVTPTLLLVVHPEYRCIYALDDTRDMVDMEFGIAGRGYTNCPCGTTRSRSLPE